MSRTARLLDLIQALRRRRRPVSAAELAAELDVSERTIYRDIATLIGQGAPIEGEAGVGYILRPGFVLPPLMFSDDEIEALVFGLRWSAARGDDPLAAAAKDALAKITAGLPDRLRDAATDVGLLVAGGSDDPATSAKLSEIRGMIRAERKARITYADAGGKESRRIIWPIALAFFDNARVVAAWCETRKDFRHFRADRIRALEATDERYPRRRGVLLAEWRKQEKVPDSI